MPLIAFAILVTPLVELYIILSVARAIGLGETIILLVAVSVAGAWLVKREGVAAWRRLQATLRRGELPTNEAIDGALILFGGALLLTPGFLTDALGLLLLFPITRIGFKGVVRRSIAWFALRRFGPGVAAARGVYSARSARTRGSTNARSPLSRSALPAEAPEDEGGSRDTG